MARRPLTRRLYSVLTPLLVFAGVLVALALSDGGGPAAISAEAVTGALPIGAEDGPTGSAIIRLRTELVAGESGSEPLAALGDLYYQRGRETGQAELGALAGQAYDEALAADPGSVAALVGKATVALVGHDFAGGLELAERAHELAPRVAATYPPLIDGLIETGAYRRAAAKIERMLSLKPGAAAYTRLSYFEELHGGARAALRAMRLAASSALPGSEPRAFALTLAGDLLFDGGRYLRAGASYKQALAERDGHPAAESGRLNVLAARGESRQAIAGYRELVEVRGFPEYADELARLEQAAGREADARAHYAILAGLHAQELARGQAADAGQVLFEADHGSAEVGVELGARVWEAAPSVTAADAYAWALRAAGRTERAARISDHALQLGTRDPLFRFHAGVIAADSGNEDRARRLLRGVLRTSPRFDPLFGGVAERRLRQLG